MNNANGIATVTAAIKDLLDNWLVQHGLASSLGDVTVTALPPDRVPVGAEERSQINLFLYRVIPNTSWRKSGVSSAGGNSIPPLALDLYYLVSAYGEQDFQMEILLGHAIEALHQNPVLTYEAIQASVNSGSGAGTSILASVDASDRGGFFGESNSLEIRPEFLSMDDSSKLWSAMQARYRPSLVYKVSTVQVGANGR